MRRAALTAFVLAAAVLATPSAAHLRPSGASGLVGMMATADGVLVARAAAATYARGETFAATPFLARETIAGDGPSENFVLDQQPPLLRYAAAQDAILLVARQQGEGRARWRSVQPAGAAILLEQATIGAQTRAVLSALWVATHPPADAQPDVAAVNSALLAALDLPEQKLRALAFLDLSAQAEDPEHFSHLAIGRLLRYGEQPGDDAQLAPAVRDLGRRLAAGGDVRQGAASATGATKP